jgi:pyrroloquinoline quinone (PQQ) biosynthesis protein C
MTDPDIQQVKALAGDLIARAPVDEHPLFLALATDALDEAQVRLVGAQIFHVVDHFPRLLAAVLSSIPDWRLRMPLVENLYCEHGRMHPAEVHAVTYRRFLAALGVTDEELAGSRPAVAVVAYNRAVLDLCLHQPYPEALGALGVIEEVVARASPLVARFAARASQVSDADAVHFSDHATLDLSHADEIYQLAARCLQMGSDARAERWAQVRRGVELGFYYHCRLYSDLLALALP